jgi:hypothetical protein
MTNRECRAIEEVDRIMRGPAFSQDQAGGSSKKTAEKVEHQRIVVGLEPGCMDKPIRKKAFEGRWIVEFQSYGVGLYSVA